MLRCVMSSDVIDLRDFYRTGLGQIARRMIRRAIQRAWPDLRGLRLLGVGYTTPFLTVAPETERTVALMPAALGVLGWPSEGPNRVTLADESELPFADYSIDRGADRPCCRGERADQADVEGGLAGSGWQRTSVDRRAEQTRHLGPARPHAIRIRQALHDVSVIATATRRTLHPNWIGHGIVHPARPQADNPALGTCLGTDRQALVS